MADNIKKEDLIEILDIVYSKIIRLNYSYRCIDVFIHSNMDYVFPDILWSLKYSFATDAFTTISALFQSGNYSFNNLIAYNVNFKEEYTKVKCKIKTNYPEIFNLRNKVYCHFQDKQKEKDVDDIIKKFYQIFYQLVSLHKKAMELFSINNESIHMLSIKNFTELDKEYVEFSKRLFMLNNYAIIDYNKYNK